MVQIRVQNSPTTGPLADVVSKVGPLLSRDDHIVNVVFVYDANTIVVSHTFPIPRKSINKIRLSFSVPTEACRSTTSKMDVFAFPMEIKGIWVCAFTTLDTSLLYLCPEKCMKVKMSIRHQKKQGSVELSSISQQFLLGRCIPACGPELPTTGVQSTDTPMQPSMSTTGLNEWLGMLDDHELFAQQLDNDLCSHVQWPEPSHQAEDHCDQSTWRDAVSEAKAFISDRKCTIHDIRQMFNLLFAVFGAFDEHCGIRKGQLVTTKYILTMVSDEVRPYLAMDMLEALESGTDALRIWTDVTLKCLGTYTRGMVCLGGH